MGQSMPVLAASPPVLVDWLPWNHTFGGNHNFGMVIYNGGTLYIDDGKPTPALMAETLRNLREIAPTVYFNVPTGFEAIANAMKTDDALRKTCCHACRCFSTPARRWHNPFGTACSRAKSAKLANAL
jgi:feruloyl-CoA synthase